MTEDPIDQLVVRASAGDEAGWQALWAAIELPLTRIIGNRRFLGHLGTREDDRRSIIVAVMGRLRAENFQRLRVYLDARKDNPQLSFLSWLRVVAKRVGIDYLRAHPDYVRRHDADRSTPGAWVNASPLPPASQIGGERPPVTEQNTVAQLLRYAQAAIAEPQLTALRMWAQSETFDTIARALNFASAAEAERIVRSGLARLRRHFRQADDQAIPS